MFKEQRRGHYEKVKTTELEENSVGEHNFALTTFEEIFGAKLSQQNALEWNK